MADWLCAIEGCLSEFQDLRSLLAHQAEAHGAHECRVCGETVPAGYFAIRHAFEEHTRAEYVRHYDANADEIRWRERIKAEVDDRIDIEDGATP
ncbi:MAG: DUF7565 family protein [Halodesulfurarchaeum sp.]